MIDIEKLKLDVDKTIVANADHKFRKHLGASVLGKECMRAVWYDFRWSVKPNFDARMCRLFERGNLTEKRFVKWLTDAGVKVWYPNEENKEHFRIRHFGGHLGGTCDAIGKYLKKYFLIEFKTHNEKSFKKLLKEGVRKAKPEHYAQMQMYMQGLKLQFALYLAINKNDDSLYYEIVEYDNEEYIKLKKRSEFVILSDEPPMKISNTKAFFKCKFCDKRYVCHDYVLPEINCRTCAHSTAEKDGLWSCQIERMDIKTQPEKGCFAHIYNPHMLKDVEVLDANIDENWIQLKMPDGGVIKHGPIEINSAALSKYYNA